MNADQSSWKNSGSSRDHSRIQKSDCSIVSDLLAKYYRPFTKRIDLSTSQQGCRVTLTCKFQSTSKSKSTQKNLPPPTPPLISSKPNGGCVWILLFLMQFLISSAYSDNLTCHPNNNEDAIHCEDKSTIGKKNIIVDLTDHDITESGDSTNVGIHTERERGDGDIDIRMKGGSITTSGVFSVGILARRGNNQPSGTFDILPIENKSFKDPDVGTIEIPDLENKYKLIAQSPYEKGNLEIDLERVTIVSNGTSNDTDSTISNAIHATHISFGYLKINSTDTDIKTTGINGDGIFALKEKGHGNVIIDIKGGSIKTEKDNSRAIRARLMALTPVSASHWFCTEEERRYCALADIWERVEVSPIQIGDLDIDVERVEFETQGDNSSVIFARQFTIGDLKIRSRDSTFVTKGKKSHAIYALHEYKGDLDIRLLDGTSIQTEDVKSPAVYAGHSYSGARKIRILVDDGATVSAKKSHGIQVGTFIKDPGTESDPTKMDEIASVGTDGYRQQTVVVNGTVTGGDSDSAGIYLVGGGKVILSGSISSASKVAVHAARKRDTDTVTDPNTDTKTNNLRVDFFPEGKPMSEVLGDNWIINDGGGTTIALNGVVIHDKKKGVTGTIVPYYGLWNVRIRKEGVNVTHRSSDTWKTEKLSGPQDRDFSAADRDFSAADFVRTLAARAAIYEALPAILMRSEGGFQESERLRNQGSELWLSADSTIVSNAKRTGSVGTRYDSELHSVEVGADIGAIGPFTGTVSGRVVENKVDVRSSVGDGTVNSSGIGVAAGVVREGADGFYVRGRLSASRYKVRLSSPISGVFLDDLDVWGLGYRAEVGRRFETADETSYTVRSWLDGRAMQFNDVTDAVPARVSLVDGQELFLGVGVDARTKWQPSADSRTVNLRGSLGVETPTNGSNAVSVSGQQVLSNAPDTRLRFGLAADWQSGRTSFGAAIEADGADAKGIAFRLGMQLDF